MSLIQDVKRICLKTGFNGNILISKNTDVLISESFGYSNFTEKVPMDESIVFRIGSVTKQFTAVAILQMVEKGLLDLSDPIERHIKEAKYDEKITIHHLLSCSSGIPNFDISADYSDYISHDNFYEIMVKNIILPLKLNFEPGEKFEYSSSGFMILTYLIELLSKQKYHEYLQNNIFDKLHMSHSGFHFNNIEIANFSSLYDLLDGNIIEASEINMKIAGGAGGLYSTTKDLFIWGEALIENIILSPKYRKMMFDVQTPINESGGYGYGVISIEFQQDGTKHRRVYHSGNGPGVFAQNNFIDSQIQLIMLSNINDGKTFRLSHDQIIELIKKQLV